MNRSPDGNHWLMVRLIGGRSNRDGLGARLTVTSPQGMTLYNHATASVGYASSSDKRVHFGLGTMDRIRTLEVLWPSGRRQTLSEVKVDQILTIREPS